MIREHVPVVEQPTYVFEIPGTHTGLLLLNTGGVDVIVDSREDVDTEGPNAGLRVGVGTTVTFPCEHDIRIPRAQVLYAVTAAGRGELTYVLPGV